MADEENSGRLTSATTSSASTQPCASWRGSSIGASGWILDRIRSRASSTGTRSPAGVWACRCRVAMRAVYPVRLRRPGKAALGVPGWEGSGAHGWAPAPPQQECSLPDPLPCRHWSLPGPPNSWSLPRPPFRRSSPFPPFSVSKPRLPSRVSLPFPPRMVSLPPFPLMVSLPPRPQMRSLPGVPTRWSFPEVPVIGQAFTVVNVDAELFPPLVSVEDVLTVTVL